MQNTNPQFKFFKDVDGDIGDQLTKFAAQDNITVVTYYEHYDKSHDTSGVIVCYMILSGVTKNESN